jgi:hypothetical protein
MAAEVKPMETAYIVTGTMIDEQTVKLDEALPLAQTKVRVAVEPLAPAPKRPHDEVIAEIRERQKARGYKPPTREEVDAYLQAERESRDD